MSQCSECQAWHSVLITTSWGVSGNNNDSCIIDSNALLSNFTKSVSQAVCYILWTQYVLSTVVLIVIYCCVTNYTQMQYFRKQMLSVPNNSWGLETREMVGVFLSSRYLAVDLGFVSSKGLVSIHEVSSQGCCHGLGSSLEGLSSSSHRCLQGTQWDAFRSPLSQTIRLKKRDGWKETECKIKQKRESHYISPTLMLEVEDQHTCCSLTFTQSNVEIL